MSTNVRRLLLTSFLATLLANFAAGKPHPSTAAAGGDATLLNPRVSASTLGRTVDEIYQDMATLAAAHPGIAELVDYGDSYSKGVGRVLTPGGDSFPGFDLLAMRLTNRSLPGPKPVFFFVATIHAREIPLPEVAMRLLEHLLAEYDSDADVTWLLDHHEIWIVPVANPDGRWYVELGLEPQYGSDTWRWRKNGHLEGPVCSWPGDNGNTYGVDLNRNFDAGWGTSGGQAGSSDPCSDHYRGSAAASEPEVYELQSLVRSLIPDQRGAAPTDAAPQDTSGIFVQIHTPLEAIGWAWGYTDAPAPNAAGLAAIGEKLASYNGYATGSVHEVIYQITGGADDWVYSELGAPSFIIEMENDSVDGVLWPKNRGAFLYAARIARTPYRTALGPDTLLPTVTDAGGTVRVSALLDSTAGGGLDIAAGELYVNVPPWQAGALALPLAALDGGFDSPTESVDALLDTSGLPLGRHTVFLRGVDALGHEGAVSAAFVYLTNNTPPTLDSVDPPPPVSLTATVPQSFQVEASDADSDPLTFTWLFDGAPVGGDSPAFELTATSAELGAHTLTVQVSDGQVSDTFSWAVDVAAGPQPGLAAHWKLDEGSGTTATDATGTGHDGILVGGPTWTIGRTGGALAFDGVDDGVVVTSGGPYDAPSALTVAAWIHHPSLGGWRSIVDKRDGFADGYDLYVNTSSRLFMRVDDHTLAGAATVADDSWHHVAGVWDGSSIRLYVDGQLDADAAVGSVSVDTVADLQIGRGRSLTNLFAGLLDDLRIYDLALSAAEVQALFTGSPPPPTAGPGPVGHWTLDEGVGTAAFDSSGNGHTGTFEGDPAWTAGILDGGLEFDGSGDGVLVSGSPLLNEAPALTVSAWVRHEALGGWRPIVDKRDAYADGFDLMINQSARLYMRVNGFTLTGGGLVADGTWHHVAGVYDGSQMVLYVDGQEDAGATVGATTLQTTADLHIGRNRTGGSRLDGVLDDVRVYDRGLNAAEVSDLAQ